MIDVWSSAVVEFVGGPADGQTMTVPTAHMGRPPHRLRVPVTPPLSVRLLDDPDPLYLEPNEAVYDSTGYVSEDRHVWPYHYRGMR